jgi:alpha-beta hydrolase superfamily lysophospholipase
VGHSLGGRAALLAAGRTEVKSVVALAPWVYATDVPSHISAEKILFVHGTEDRVASPERSAALARRLGERTRVSYVRVEGGRHAMLHRHRAFEELAADFTVATLLGSGGGATVQRALAGGAWITL